MLRNIFVKNLALIDEIELQLEEGLTVLTGETGAGKSVLLGSIAVGLGLKTPGDMLRDNGEDSYIVLCFNPVSEAVAKRLENWDIKSDNGTVIILRKIHDKRSSFKINGINVTSSQVKELAPFLLDLHAQRDNLLLLKDEEQLKLVDSFCDFGFYEVLEKTKIKYNEYKDIRKQLKESDIDEEEKNREQELICHEVNEIKSLAPKPGEYEELEKKFEISQNSMKIKEALSNALGCLTYDQANIAGLLTEASLAVSKVRDYDERLKNAVEALSNADSIVSDVINELNDYSSQIEGDGEDFSFISERLDAYNRLRHKYNTDTNGLLKLLDEKEKKVQQLEDNEAYVAALKEKYSKVRHELSDLYNVLHEKRVDSAAYLAEKIKDAAKDLNFNTVEFEIDVQKGKTPSEIGLDRVCFMFSSNPGEKVKPLKDVASGGELSRMMLAIKTVTAGIASIATLIFDEIDTGISGRTAQKVGEKMALLADNRQIICITHLPQIAAMADKHFLISKSADTGRSVTDIKELSDEESVYELSRMLGGSEITDSVMANAEEMKGLAREYKQNNRT